MLFDVFSQRLLEAVASHHPELCQGFLGDLSIVILAKIMHGVMFKGNTDSIYLATCMIESAVITFKVPREMKKKMNEVNVNWSEYFRQCAQKKIDEQRRRIASEKLDEIRKLSKPTSNEEIVAWIREDRER